MTGLQGLGHSQPLSYGAHGDEQIGARLRARLKEQVPRLTQAQFATRIELTPDALSRALNGKRALSAIELEKAAKLLGTSAHWLVTGEPDPFAVKVAGRQIFDHAVKAHQPFDWSAADEVISQLALAYLQVYPAPTVTGGSGVPRSASEARDALRHCQDADFIRHLADVTEAAFGVDIVRVGGFRDGLAMEVVGRSAIIVGESGNWFFENWSIAHELGHIAHDDLSEFGTAACDDPSAERAANAFAAELLLPERLIESESWDVMDIGGLARFIWSSGVSTNALQNRLSSLGIAPSPTAASGLAMTTQALLRRSGILRGRSGDPITQRMQDASSRRFPGHLLSAHAAAISEGKIGAEILAWMLGVPAAELDEQLAPPTATPVDIDDLARQLGLVDPKD